MPPLADAMAFAHEGRAPGPPPPLRVGGFSDDTQLTLATCEALAETGGDVDPEVVAAHILRWHREQGIVGAGSATAKALKELAVGGHWALVGRRGEFAAGNGAAIRIAPLSFVLDLSATAGRQKLRDVARVTHHNDEAYSGALALALALQDGMDRGWHGREALFGRLASELPDTRLRDRLEAIRTRGASLRAVASSFGASGYVVESVPLALHAYAEAAEHGDYLRMVADIVACGGDCDSVASMAGQCFGGLFTDAALPADTLPKLPPIVGLIADTLHRTLDGREAG